MSRRRTTRKGLELKEDRIFRDRRRLGYKLSCLSRDWTKDPLNAAADALSYLKRHNVLDIARINGPVAALYDLHLVAFAANWAICGYPTIDIDTIKATSLMGTAVYPEMIEHLLPPWKAFAIRLNDPILRAQNGTLTFRLIWVLHHSFKTNNVDKWLIILEPTQDCDGLFFTVTPEVMCNDKAQCESSHAEDKDSSKIENDTRITAKLVKRLIAGSCFTMSNKDILESSYSGVSYGNPKREKKDPIPPYNVYMLKKSLELPDIRNAIYDLYSGKRKELKTQTLVRGHWKRQAHGKNMALRKVIQIAPYWRGPDEAPISARCLKMEE